MVEHKMAMARNPRMRTFCILLALAAFSLGGRPAPAQEEPAAVDETAAVPPTVLSADEIRKLVAPVALYPDDLLALVLPASTNPLQIVQAQRFLEKQAQDKNLKPDENWDPSVLALLNYPEVIAKMNDDLEWTENLGNAVIDQQKDVMDTIQQVRSEANAGGYLKSDDKQVVVQEKETIIIQSASPDVIYVPSYDPQVVYMHDYHSYPPPYYSPPYPYYYAPGAAFFTGMFVGAAFSYGFDWGDNDININNNFNRNTNINTGDIGNRDRVEHNRGGDRFNADNRRVNGGDKMTWNGNKARQKQTAKQRKAGASAGTLPARNNKGAANKRTGAGNSKLKNPANANRGNRSSMGNYQSNRAANKAGNQGRQSMQKKNTRQGGGSQMQNRKRSSAGAFGGYGNGSRATSSSKRGSSSMRTSRGSRGGRR
jgi:Protein of unknown function (DUF3300)